MPRFLLLTLAILLGIADFYFSETPNRINTIFLFFAVTSLAATGWHPKTGGILFLTTLATGLLLPESSIVVGVIALGIYAVFAVWISREWWLATSSAFFIFSLIHIPGSKLEATLLELTLGTFLSLIIGVGIHRHIKSTTISHQHLRAERQRALKAIDDLNRSTSILLHDTVAAHLVRAITATEEAFRASNDAACQELILASIQSQRAALSDLRLIIDSTPELSSAPEDLQRTLEDCKRSLTLRSIDLEVDLPQELEDILMGEPLQFTLALIREGCVNILKHGDDHSNASLIGEMADSGLFSLSLISTFTDGSHIDSTTSGGLGLNSLSLRADRIGAHLEAQRFNDRWILSGVIPVPQSAKEIDPL